MAKSLSGRVRQKLADIKDTFASWREGNLRGRTESRQLARQIAAAGPRKFIVFLVPGHDVVNGGNMSIVSIAQETQTLRNGRSETVVLCTGYGEPALRRFTKFSNPFEFVPFEELVAALPGGAEVLVHVPELFLQRFVTQAPRSIFRDDIGWRFNILLQNIDLIPSRDAVVKLQRIGKASVTTAHKAYANEETAHRLGCPVHHLSTMVCPENYQRTGFAAKDKLIIVSPDSHPAKADVISQIAAALPDHRIVEIRNMTYETYRGIIQRAKFAFTFGEGLDGYFVEPIFSGGVGMAIYNDRFFTGAFRDLSGVFADSRSAIQSVGEFLRRTDSEGEFAKASAPQFELLARTYVRAEYIDNLRNFYERYAWPADGGTPWK